MIKYNCAEALRPVPVVSKLPCIHRYQILTTHLLCRKTAWRELSGDPLVALLLSIFFSSHLKLVHSKVRIAGRFCRVGVRIRSNPSNRCPMSGVTLLLSVPQGIDGETVKMSRKGGVWDPMKRIVVWDVPSLGIGDTVEVQSQFEFTSRSTEKDSEGSNLGTVARSQGALHQPKFPLLVRCSVLDDQLSAVGIDINNKDEISTVRVNLERSFRVLHRRI